VAAGGYKIKDSHFFTADSSVCVAFVTSRYSGTNTGSGARMFDLLNAQISHFQQSHPDVRILYHGTPASGYYNSRTVKNDLAVTLSVSLAVVALIIMVSYRRWDTIPLLILPVVFGLLVGMALMYLVKGSLSVMSLGMGGVVLGVAMSYVVHLLTHAKFVDSVEQLLREQVKPISMGCVTTIFTLLGLLFVKTDLLRDFGLFANLLGFIPLQLGGREGGFAITVAGLGMTAALGLSVSIICRLREITWDIIGVALMKMNRK